MNIDAIFYTKYTLYTVCFLTWSVPGLIGFVMFYVRKDIDHKRKWFPRFLILSGVLFVLTTTAGILLDMRSWTGLGALILVLPAVAVITLFNLKMTSFCDGCGAIFFEQNILSSLRVCPKCGSEVDPKPSLLPDVLE